MLKHLITSKAVTHLRESMEERSGESLALWKTIVAFEGYIFQTSGRGSKQGVKFRYVVSRSGGNSGRHFNTEPVKNTRYPCFFNGHMVF